MGAEGVYRISKKEFVGMGAGGAGAGGGRGAGAGAGHSARRGAATVKRSGAGRMQ